MGTQGNLIEVTVDEATLKAIQLKLKNAKSKAPRALKNAVNATARDAKKDLAAKAQQTYTIKTSKFKKNIKQKNATVAKPEALLNVSGKMNKLENFQTRKNTKKLGAKARGRNDRSLKEIISQQGQAGGGRSFTGTFKSGHTGIVQRTSAARLPLRSFYGPSDPEMVGNDDVYGKIEPDIQKLLYKNISRQIDKVLGG